MKKWNVIYYSVLLLFYLFFGTLFTVFYAFICGVADAYLIITFGIINSLLSFLFFKTNLLKSILIGFFISGMGFLSSYILLIFLLILNFNDSSDILILPLLFNVIIQTFLWKYIENSLKFYTIRNFSILGVLTIMTLIVSLNLWDYWKYESIYKSHLKTPVSIKLIDSVTGEPIIGDTIELLNQRQPLYGFLYSPLYAEKITNQKGMATFEIYSGNYYDGYVLNKNEYFQIRDNLKTENDTIQIEILINEKKIKINKQNLQIFIKNE